MRSDFLNYRADMNARNGVAIEALIDQSAQRLQQLGEMIPILDGMSESLASGNDEHIVTSLSRNWPLLQLQSSIESVALYDTGSSLIWATGFSGSHSILNDTFVQYVSAVTRSEQPDSFLECSMSCIQYAVVPVLVQGRLVGTILLGASLADSLIYFSNVSATNIGIIISSPGSQESGSLGDRLLEKWHANVSAITNSATMLDIINKVSNEHSLENVLIKGVTTRYLGKSYEVKLKPLLNVIQDAQTYLVIIDDISALLEKIAAATRNTIMAGMLGFLLSVVLLLLVLWRPMSRLRRTAAALPLLAQNSFEEARHRIERPARFRLASDEIDRLDESAITLSFQLENLENEIRDHNKVLSQKNQELTLERDFIKRLLNTAQAIVLTQDQSGNILQVNRFAASLAGYKESRLLKGVFSDLFGASFNQHHRSQLKLVANGRRRHFKHEARLNSRNKGGREIEWLHSYLKGEAADAAVILSVGMDITDRKSAEQRVIWFADHDPLTGLFNRRRFHDEFQNVLTLAERYSQKGALVFIDLDHFKYVNDTNGHIAGDCYIKGVADALMHVLRASDIIARVGGDEFAVVVREINAEQAIALAETFNSRLDRLDVAGIEKGYKTSASIGIALYPDHGNTVSELLANADIAMYQAKERGRGRWHMFSRGEHAREKLEQQMILEQKTENALSNDLFTLYYQPIMALPSGDISHYEALLRMKDEDGNVLTPEAFISVAEKTGLILDIDHLVLKKGIASLGRALRKGHDMKLALNLSAHSLTDSALLPMLSGLLEVSGIPPNRLIFEITETAALADFPAACTLIESISSMGCKFALDDFGVGFSSFSYLKQLPVDFIKIDGSFIRKLQYNEDDQIIVKAITDIARGFGKQTVAEFVEDEETFQLLQEYKVDYVQGYHIGHPMSEIKIVNRGTDHGFV